MTQYGTIHAVAVSDRGRVREQQEDSWLARTWPQGWLAILAVADGMGGHAGGEIASRLAIAAVEEVLAPYFDGLHPTATRKLDVVEVKEAPADIEPKPDFHTRKLPETQESEQKEVFQKLLRQAVNSAQQAIVRTAVADPEGAGDAGSTLTLAAIQGNHLYIAHVGDSRVYHWRQSRLYKLTQDHSGAAMLVAAGIITAEEARDHPESSRLYRFLGGKDKEAECDFYHVNLGPADLILLCSDGLWNKLTDAEIALLLIEHPDIDILAQALVDAANEKGGEDNISVIVAQVNHHKGKE